MSELGIGLIGAGWISQRYAEALREIPGARLRAVASRSAASAERLASQFDVDLSCTYDELETLFSDPRIDLVCVNSTNQLHAIHALAALEAGKHVIIEKPLCLRLQDAEALIRVSEEEQRMLGYAENLCFVPLLRRARELVSAGELGEIESALQCEKHGGPYSDWFFETESAGGGALMDMGCHGIACLLWLLDAPQVRSVEARLGRSTHAERGPLEDEAWVRLELASGASLVSESSWVAPAMQSRLELRGSAGTLELELGEGGGLRLNGEDRAGGLDPQDDTGYPQELQHFLNCVREGLRPEIGARAGRDVLEILWAAYASAASGRAQPLPFDPGEHARPVDVWVDGSRDPP